MPKPSSAQLITVSPRAPAAPEACGARGRSGAFGALGGSGDYIGGALAPRTPRILFLLIFELKKLSVWARFRLKKLSVWARFGGFL